MLLLFSLFNLAFSECDIPNFSVGTSNITSERQLKDLISKEPLFLLGLSHQSCSHYCDYEKAYKDFFEESENNTQKVPLFRHDGYASTFIKKYVSDFTPLPQLFGFYKGSFFKYYDSPDGQKIRQFTERLASPIGQISDLQEALDFLKPPTGANVLKIVALLSDKNYLESYERGIKNFANWFSSDFRVVIGKDLVEKIRSAHPEIPYSNSLILTRADDQKHFNLELPQDISKWVLSNAVGLVEKLTPSNSYIYSLTQQPMVIMFTDPNNQYSSKHLEEFKKSAKKLTGFVSFVWLDATDAENISKKKKLGLNTEILPAIAFSSKTSAIYPFTEGAEISEKNIDEFVKDYLAKKKSEYKGVYVSNEVSLDSCDKIGFEEFEEQVFAEDDVLVILFSTHLSRETQKATPELNRICRRFKDLEFEKFKVVAFDAALNRVHRTVDSSKFPAVFLKSGKELVRYEGEITALSVMKFVEGKIERVKLPEESPHMDKEELEELKRAEKMKHDL